MIRKKAFTLTELLIALSIVGAIAALSIPALIEDVNRRLLVNQLKNTVVTVQQLIDQQLIENNTKKLQDTDFAKPTDLLSAANFAIADNCTTVAKCWADKGSNPAAYRILSDLTYKQGAPGTKTIKLKNGVTLTYYLDSIGGTINDGTKDGDKCYGLFFVDVNGKDKPNIVGRDFFAFRITEKGKIVYGTSCNGIDNSSDDQLATWCKNDSYSTACLAHIQRNNWKMKY